MIWIIPLTCTRLKQLKVSVLGISEVSFTEGVCCSLESLNIYKCINLTEIGTLPNTLTRLYCTSCHNLRKIDALYRLTKLEWLHLFDSMELKELPHMGTLVSLTFIMIADYAKLKSVWGLGQLTKLREFRVCNCPELQELEGLQDCRLLQRLTVKKCPKLCCLINEDY